MGWKRRYGERTVEVYVSLLVTAVAISAVMMMASKATRPPAQAVHVGVTLTQRFLDELNPEEATERARQTFQNVAEFGNQHIMGWGALNPAPAPGERDWESLDARVRLIESASVTPVITLCCAPDWMKGGSAGDTDWSKLEAAPHSENFADFAELAVDVALRYPQVKHFVVWNELKGFYDAERGRWDIESYTELYNQVYRALKRYDSTIAVGGPYVPIDSWSDAGDVSHPSAISGPWGVLDQRALDAINYWLLNANGADFVAVDGSNRTKDAGLIVEPRLANEKFAAVTRWLVSRTSLPVWWMELYPHVMPDDDVNSPYAADIALDAILRIGDAGGDAVFLWQPEASPDFRSVALWDSTAVMDGGQPKSLAARLEELEEIWSSGSAAAYEWRGDRLVLTPVPPP
jgi:hypothetical protein